MADDDRLGDEIALRLRDWVGYAGLPAGPLLALVVFLALPEALPGVAGEPAPVGPATRATAAVAAWMATWWLTEAIPVYATALLPIVLFPLLGIAGLRDAAAPYAHPLIFLFLGGFLVALAMQRWGLDRRTAFRTLAAVGSEPRRIVGGFMLVTALLSMWISNTATALVMLPIAESVIRLGRPEREPAPAAPGSPDVFGESLLLGVAYAASIGGVATLVGTPPNLFLASWFETHAGRAIGFAEWMLVGVPVAGVFLPLAWWVLVRRLPRQAGALGDAARVAGEAHRALGPMGRGERVTLGVGLAAAALFVVRPWLQGLELGGGHPLAGLADPVIAMGAALLLFAIPVDPRRRVFALDWRTAGRVPYGVLLLFGGGLSLARAIDGNGVAELVGGLVAGLGAVPGPVLVLAVVLLVIFLTELTSNTATTATFVPLLAGVAAAVDLPVELLVVPAALAASCAFMLPVATPPNAVVFGTGRIRPSRMIREGLVLNAIGTVLIAAAAYGLVLPVLGAWSGAPEEPPAVTAPGSPAPAAGPAPAAPSAGAAASGPADPFPEGPARELGPSPWGTISTRSITMSSRGRSRGP